MHTCGLSYIQHRVITEWLIYMVCPYCLKSLWGKFCFVLSELFHCRHIVTCTASLAVLWMEKKKSGLIAVIHHSRGICLIEKFKVPHQWERNHNSTHQRYNSFLLNFLLVRTLLSYLSLTGCLPPQCSASQHSGVYSSPAPVPGANL